MSELTEMILLYEEIIFEILKHLPSKSLMRFRCVSKDWLRIIQDSYFVDYHRARSHTRLGGIQLVSVMDCGFRSCILSDPEGNFQTRLENSLPDATDRISYAEALICSGNHIWNPSTRETMYIPQVQTCSNIMPISWDNLLGFDAFSNKYKVVCCLNCRTQIVNRKNLAKSMPLLHVLTLGENCWKQIPFIPDKLLEGFDILSSRSFSNMIFCMIRCSIKPRFDGIKERFGVLTFDVQHEHVGFISFPGMFKFKEADLPIHLADIEGHLAFQFGVEQTLWVLNHEIAQWTKMEITFAGCYLFNPWYGYVTDGHDDIIANLVTIGTVHTNEILFQCDVVTEDYIKRRHLKYLYYDPMTKEIRFASKLEKNVDGIRDFMMIKHIDSVVRLIPPTQKDWR